MSTETVLRLAVFFTIMLLMMSLEWVFPRRLSQNRALRWPSNLGIVVFNSLLLMLVPITAAGASLFSVFNHFGLLLWLQTPLWPAIIVSLVILDCAIYWQHRLFHSISALWPIHRMHHTDTQFDVTTGLRFHPVEIVISILIKAVVIILLGVPLLAVIAFEIILNGMAMFNHANLRLPGWLDRALRIIVVTPDMHRVHHSVYAREYNTNYGFNLSVWDRVFGSYTPQPSDGHVEMRIGQAEFRQSGEARLDRMLSQPFRRAVLESNE